MSTGAVSYALAYVIQGLAVSDYVSKLLQRVPRFVSTKTDRSGRVLPQ